MAKKSLGELLKQEPEILSDSKRMMTLLVEYLPERRLNKIVSYNYCVKSGIVGEMLQMDCFNDEDLAYFADKLYYGDDNEKRLESQEAFDIICDWFKMLNLNEVECDDSGLRYRVLSYNIEDLKVNDDTREFFEKAQIQNVGDLLNLNIKDLFAYQKEFYFDFNAVAANIFDLICDIEKMGNDIYTEDKHPGKKRCELLRKIRKEIADANGIEFEPHECHHNGPCMGTCPACDSELEYLNKKLDEKKWKDEPIKVDGLVDKEIVMSGCDVEPRAPIFMGRSVPRKPKYRHNGKEWYPEKKKRR